MDNRQVGSSGNTTNLPDFIIIGAQKAGTSALRHNLNKHPEIYMATVEQGNANEPNFFSRGKNWEKGLSWYTSLFYQTDKIQGEKTPDIFFIWKAMERMAQTIPNAKIITLLRNPITRAYSAWNHNNQIIEISQNWGWRIVDFETAIVLAEQKVEPFVRLLHKGYYIQHINRLVEYFPREQLFFGITERFKQHPNEQINNVLDFLGAAPMDLEPEIRHSRKYTEQMSLDAQVYLDDIYKPMNEQLKEFLDDDIPEWNSK